LANAISLGSWKASDTFDARFENKNGSAMTINQIYQSYMMPSQEFYVFGFLLMDGKYMD
jgi:hypothetical protein